jgi:hypothetical protein
LSTIHRLIAAARASIVLNAALFQLGWWACILLAADDRPAPAALALAAIVAIHVLTHAAPLRALRLALACLAIGALVEPILVALGVIAYRPTGLTWGQVPPWMIGLWALLSTTLGVSLRWLSGLPLLGVALGAAGGAVSYAAGARLGALVLPSAWSLWVIAAAWGAALPALVWLSRRWEGDR